MARSLLRTGDYPRVAELLVESLVIFADLGVRIRVALSLIGLAELSYLEGDPVRAIKLYASSQTLLNSIGSAMNLAYSEEAKHNFRAARERLDPAALEEAWTAGAAMTMQEAVNYALEGLARAVRAVRIRRLLRVRQSGTLFNYETGNVENAASLLGLSSRELQVLRNVAAGLSDPQIASALHISSRTVEAHLRSVYNKLEVTNRRAAVKRAAELNLL